jgi:archaellum component FlaG (FlaF/FlaG flagellin family)
MSTRQVVKNLYWSAGYYTLTVPNGYTPTVEIVLAGAGGGQGGQYYYTGGGGGGYGAILKGSIPVKAGDTLEVYLGEGGRQGAYSFSGGAGGRGAKIGDFTSGIGTGQVWPVTLSWAWSQFMNDYAVWVNPDGVNPVNATSTVTRTFYVPETGTYRIRAECDNWMNLYVDGSNIINTSDFQSVYGSYADMSLTQGNHLITMAVSNWGGPAGFAVEISRGTDPVVDYGGGYDWSYYNGYFSVDPDTGLTPQLKAAAAVGTVIWHTRIQPQPPANTYWLKGGNGGNTYPDGNYIYPAPGGGGGGSAVFLNGTLVIISGGGGGGGAEGGHGAAGGAGYDAGEGGSGSSTDIYAYGAGQNGSDGYDIGGQPGGGGGFVGGAPGGFIYYDDAPSSGAYGGSNYINPLYSFSKIGRWGGGPSHGSNGYCSVTFSELGSGKVKVGGSWKQITSNYIKVGTQWKEIRNAWTKANGVWKLVSGGAPIPESFTSGNYG